MNVQQLHQNLQKLGVGESNYSLNGELKNDAIILYPNYAKWEVFYMSERFSKNDEKTFSSESDACEYIFKKFQRLVQTEKKFGITSLRPK